MKYATLCAMRFALTDQLPVEDSTIDTLKNVNSMCDMDSLWPNVVAALEKANEKIAELNDDARGVTHDYERLETELLELQEKYDAVT